LAHENVLLHNARFKKADLSSYIGLPDRANIVILPNHIGLLIKYDSLYIAGGITRIHRNQHVVALLDSRQRSRYKSNARYQ
jgi:hypothetical protein